MAGARETRDSALPLVIKLKESERLELEKRWEDEGKGLGLSTWARQLLLGKSHHKSEGLLQLLARKMADIDLLDKDDEGVQRFIRGD